MVQFFSGQSPVFAQRGPDPRSALAQALIQGGTQATPVRNPIEGLGRLASALSGAFIARTQADEEKKRSTDASATLSKALAGFNAPEQTASATMPAPGAGDVTASFADFNPGSTGMANVVERELDPNEKTARLASALAGNPDLAPIAANIQLTQAMSQADAQREAEAARNNPKLPTGMRMGQNGQPEWIPGYLEAQERLRAAGRSSTTVNNNMGGGIDYGDPPKDFAWARNEDGSIATQVDPETGFRSPVAIPISGGPVARDDAAEAEEAKAREGAATVAGAEEANTMLSSIKNIREEMESADLPVTGTTSRPFGAFSGTAAGRVRSHVGALKSGVVLGAMQALKEASATGATGFGAMNEKELQLLIDNIGALDPDSTEPDIFLDTLDRIESRYNRVVDDIRRNVAPERIKELGLEPLLSTGARSRGGASEVPDFGAMNRDDLFSFDIESLDSVDAINAYREAIKRATQNGG